MWAAGRGKSSRKVKGTAPVRTPGEPLRVPSALRRSSVRSRLAPRPDPGPLEPGTLPLARVRAACAADRVSDRFGAGSRPASRRWRHPCAAACACARVAGRACTGLRPWRGRSATRALAGARAFPAQGPCASDPREDPGIRSRACAPGLVAEVPALRDGMRRAAGCPHRNPGNEPGPGGWLAFPASAPRGAYRVSRCLRSPRGSAATCGACAPPGSSSRRTCPRGAARRRGLPPRGGPAAPSRESRPGRAVRAHLAPLPARCLLQSGAGA
jgi:hypothetical protein